jgi:hypothetical protein
MHAMSVGTCFVPVVKESHAPGYIAPWDLKQEHRFGKISLYNPIAAGKDSFSKAYLGFWDNRKSINFYKKFLTIGTHRIYEY